MAMRSFSTEAKVGVAVLTALVLLIGLTFQIGKFRFSRSGFDIEAVFRTVSGLDTKAKVRLAGVLVGEVDRIFLRDGLAHVILRLDDGTVVREDSVVSIATIGILSEFYVDITAGTAGSRVLQPGDVVVGRELVDLNEMVARMVDLSGSVKELVQRIGDTLGGKDTGVGGFIERLNVLVEKVGGVVEQVDGIVAENRRGVAETVRESAAALREGTAALADARGILTDNRADLHATVASLRDFSGSLGRHADELSRQVRLTAEELRAAVGTSRTDVHELVGSLRAAAEKADRAAASLDSILAKVDGGGGTLGRLVNDAGPFDKVDRAAGSMENVAKRIDAGEGTIGRLVTDDHLIGQVESAVDKVNRFLGDSEKTHLYLGFRAEYLGDADAAKSYATIKLQPREDKFYLLEVVGDPRGRRTITETTTTIERPEGGYEISEHTVVDEVSRLNFSLQYAQTFGPLTLRAGLLESQGGVGADLGLAGDRLRLSVEGWDFGRDAGMHLKLSARAKVYKELYLTGGVDELAEPSLRSWFLGAGILFSDDDLKSVLAISRFAQ